MGIKCTLCETRQTKEGIEEENNIYKINANGVNIYFKYQRSLYSCFANSLYMAYAFLLDNEKIGFNPEIEVENILKSWINGNIKGSAEDFRKLIFHTDNIPDNRDWQTVNWPCRDLLDIRALKEEWIIDVMKTLEDNNTIPRKFSIKQYTDSKDIVDNMKKFFEDKNEMAAVVFGACKHAHVMLKNNGKFFVISSNHYIFDMENTPLIQHDGIFIFQAKLHDINTIDIIKDKNKKENFCQISLINDMNILNDAKKEEKFTINYMCHIGLNKNANSNII